MQIPSHLALLQPTPRTRAAHAQVIRVCGVGDPVTDLSIRVEHDVLRQLGFKPGSCELVRVAAAARQGVGSRASQVAPREGHCFPPHALRGRTARWQGPCPPTQCLIFSPSPPPPPAPS